MRIEVPRALADAHIRHLGPRGPAWTAGLPALAEAYLRRWRLRLDGPATHGMVALVLPVRRADGTPAVLKLQPSDEETRGEPAALRAWEGRGAVRLIDADTTDTRACALLLERLGRPLTTLPGHLAATRIVAGLLARLHAVPPPPGLRRLGDIAGAMIAAAPAARRALTDPADRRLLDVCTSAVRDLTDDPGQRLLHWDLHDGNVLHAPGDADPWHAIDPKPLVGDPAFDLMPMLHNRWDDAVATGDPARAVRDRFDLMTDMLGLQRPRAAGWTLGRVLQNTLWDVEDGAHAFDPVQRLIAEALHGDYRP